MNNGVEQVSWHSKTYGAGEHLVPSAPQKKIMVVTLHHRKPPGGDDIHALAGLSLPPPETSLPCAQTADL